MIAAGVNVKTLSTARADRDRVAIGPAKRIGCRRMHTNYVQTAAEGEIVRRTELDRRDRTVAVLKSDVEAEDSRLVVTAIGSYSISPRKR
jgi:acyl-coenzyme A thioesterase PaaI-like protein